MNRIMNIARRMSDILRAYFLFMGSGAKQKKLLFFMEVTEAVILDKEKIYSVRLYWGQICFL